MKPMLRSPIAGHDFFNRGGLRVQALWLARAVWVAFFLLTSYPAAAVPVSIAWDVPLSPDEIYLLEVASDAGFAKVLLTMRVRGNGYMWETPNEGVYHWRLTRGEALPKDAEMASNIASGSFVALDPGVKRTQAVKLSWDKVAGADRYKLYVMEGGSRERTMVTQAPFFILPKIEAPTTVEVVPFSEGHRTQRGYQMQPSLRLTGGAPPPVVVPPPPPPTQVIVTQPVQPPAPEMPPQPRKYEIFAFGMGEKEQITTTKASAQAVSLRSTRTVAGGGAGLWVNPAYGIVVAGQGDYHQVKDTNVTQESLFPGKKLSLSAARYSADLNVGYNVLEPFGVQSQALVFGVTGASAQVPTLPDRYTVDAANPPGWKRLALSMFGGGMAYSYLGELASLDLAGGMAVESTMKASYAYGRLMVAIYPYEHLVLKLGAFGRREQTSHCATDAAVCSAEGPVRTTITEGGGLLGLGLVFF